MGTDLLMEVVEATGLPTDWAKNELTKMLNEAGIDPGKLTLDQLRDVLALHIGDALLKAKEDSLIEAKF